MRFLDMSNRDDDELLIHEAGLSLEASDRDELDDLFSHADHKTQVRGLLRLLPRAFRRGLEEAGANWEEVVRGLRNQLAAKTQECADAWYSSEKLSERVALLSATDLRTNLTNLTNFESWVGQGLQNEKRRIWFSVFFIDLENFKWANDNLGMLVGDKIIVRFAEILRNQFRADERIEVSPAWAGRKIQFARYGNGDEFIVGFTTGSQTAALGLIQRFDDELHGENWSAIHPELGDHRISMHRAAICVRVGSFEDRGSVQGVAEAIIALASQKTNEDKARNKAGDRREKIRPTRCQIVAGKLIPY